LKILITAATKFELEAISDSITSDHSIDTLITGIGMTATAFHLGTHLAKNQYDLVINVGIAGAFNYDLQLGDVVEVEHDQFSELGAEDGDSFLNLYEIGLSNENALLSASHSIEHSIKKVTGITVNKVHGNENSIKQIIKRLSPDTESMEGAAFLYACKMNKVNCIQLRAISNYVEKRNRNAWQIELALSNLANELEQILK
jgi:futalosine hydrolase